MKLIDVVILLLVIMRAYTKNHSAAELNRIRISTLYRNHLLTRPSMENSTQTVVAIGLGIIEVAGIDPQTQVITLNANFDVRWCDDLLRWNTSEQLCMTRRNRSEIFFNPQEIWTPDIVATNGPGKRTKDSKFQYPILSICSGSVRWSYQDRLVSFCKIDVQNFPFDRQYCSILLQSTIYDSSQLKLRSLYKVVRLYNFINTEWEITHVTIEEIDIYNPHHERDFSTIKIDIELVRLSRFYIVKIILPFCVISTLALFSFCLPTDSGEKIALTVSILLSLTFYLQIISDYVPKTERGFCMLTLYSSIIFSIVFLSCIFNIFTIFIYYHGQYFLKIKTSKLHRKKSILLTINESLLKLDKQRRQFSKKSSKKKLPDSKAIDILHDFQHMRQLLMNIYLQKDFGDFRPQLFQQQQAVKRIAVLIDRILFFIYLILMPLAILILFKSNDQSRLSSYPNQLLDIRKTASEPMPIFRGCPN